MYIIDKNCSVECTYGSYDIWSAKNVSAMNDCDEVDDQLTAVRQRSERSTIS